jgi:hypothetical protein
MIMVKTFEHWRGYNSFGLKIENEDGVRAISSLLKVQSWVDKWNLKIK